MESRFLRIPVLLFPFAALMATSCATGPSLRMAAQRPPVDESVLAPELKQKPLKRVVVLPPQGAPRGFYDGIMALFEKQMLRNGLQLLSHQTLVEKGGKVPMEDAPDAVLELSEWRWSKELAPRRFFIFDEVGGESFREVSQSVYQASNTYKVAFPAMELRFLGKLTDAATGDLLATFDLRSPVNFNLPNNYVAGVELMPNGPLLKTESFPYASKAWVDEALKLTEAVIVKFTVDKFSPKEKTRKVASEEPATNIEGTNDGGEASTGGTGSAKGTEAKDAPASSTSTTGETIP